MNKRKKKKKKICKTMARENATAWELKMSLKKRGAIYGRKERWKGFVTAIAQEESC